MSDTLLPFYNRELNAIRALAAEFARAYPKVAGRLRLTEEAVDDPHVARLLEGVAFLAARVHHRLDDEFPELTDALLGVLYPHYLSPVPSAAIVKFAAAKDAPGAITVPAGLTLETEPVRGDKCTFRTACAAVVWPIEIDSVRLSGLPLAAPAHPIAPRASSVLRIAISCANPETTLQELGVDRLRFFLRAASNVSLPLLELICAHTIGVALADGAGDAAATFLPAAIVKPCGFADNEALLPFPARGFAGFRLLTEYFALPEKFRFFDITGLEGRVLAQAANRLEIFLYLDRALPELERLVDKDTLALGCVPVVNLFAHQCDPIPLDHYETEYRIEPSERRPGALEIWSVERVRETRADGSQRQWQPFYRLAAGHSTDTPGGFFNIARRASPTLSGTDVFLAPYDPDFNAGRAADTVLSVDALCSNRDLPQDLPFGGGQPRLTMRDGLSGIVEITCLTAPSATLRPPLRARGFWPLVSQLSLGHLSVVGGADGAQALREVLRLYDFRDSEDSRAGIAGLVGVTAKPGTARVPLPPGVDRLPASQAGAFVRGLDVTLEWDRRAWEEGGLYVLAAVLEQFLALHATVNSFVRTSCVLRGRRDAVAKWPARAGTRVLL